jgi:RNA-directed DNA polymerase
VEETDAYGNRRGTTRNKDQGMGTPQGAPISPLLSNIYMRRFVKGWKVGGHERRLAAQIVNYADDFVICCKGTADEAMTVMRGMMSKLKLTVNEPKTRLCTCRMSRLTSWATPLAGMTVAARAHPTWERVHRERKSTGYAGRLVS